MSIIRNTHAQHADHGYSRQRPVAIPHLIRQARLKSKSTIGYLTNSSASYLFWDMENWPLIFLSGVETGGSGGSMNLVPHRLRVPAATRAAIHETSPGITLA